VSREPRVFARAELRRRLPSFVCTNLAVVATLLALVVALGFVLSFAVHGYERGFFDGALTMAYLAGICLVFLMHDNSFGRLGGAWAEEATRDELKRAERRGYVWETVNGVALDGYDIDHVVFSPAGVLVIDSKWHFKANSVQHHADACGAARSARSARAVLRSLGENCEPKTLVVVAGPGSSELGSGETIIDGVQILARGCLLEWLGSHQTGRYPQDHAQRVADQLREFRATHGPRRKIPRRFAVGRARANSQ
jgi:hypothetical protein